MGLIARAAVLGVRLSVNERNGRLRVEGRGDVPKPLMDQVRAMRDPLVLELTQGARARLDLAREHHKSFLDDVRRRRPPDVSDSRWQAAIDGLGIFLAVGHGDEAERLGWPHDELYRVPKLWSQIHLCGAALLIGDREVVEVSPTAIKIRTASGATQAFYRKPAVDYGLAYRERIRQLGLDASKEEAQLRAVEAVVNLYRSRHPSADIDTAKASVLAAIAKAKEKV
jgi:hypothetical protein